MNSIFSLSRGLINGLNHTTALLDFFSKLPSSRTSIKNYIMPLLPLEGTTSSQGTTIGVIVGVEVDVMEGMTEGVAGVIGRAARGGSSETGLNFSSPSNT